MEEGHIALQGPIGLACAQTECWSCHQTTPVYALIASKVLEVEDGDVVEETEDESFVYDISQEDMPLALSNALGRAASSYVPTFSRTTGETNWANVCEHCSRLQGAFFLHSEPDGPFFGEAAEFEGTRLNLSDESFTVVDASYSL